MSRYLAGVLAAFGLAACGHFRPIPPDRFGPRLVAEAQASFGRWIAACGPGTFGGMPRLVVVDADLGPGILGAEGRGGGWAPEGEPWIAANRSADWSRYDLGTVVDHEVGHALGLRHTDQATGRPLMRPRREPGEAIRPGPGDCPR